MQRISAHAAALACGVPSVLMALLGGEVWPFLDYRMHAAKFTPEIDWLARVGRTDNGAPFPLDDKQYIVTFGRRASRSTAGLKPLFSTPP
jgi:hypothetical protein